MAMTFAILTGSRATAGSIKQFANSDAFPADTVLEDAQALVYNRLRVREMLTSTSGTMTASASTLALASDCLAIRRVMITGTEQGKIRVRPAEEVEESFAYDQNGTLVLDRPVICYADKSNLVFPVRADKAYVIRQLYYQRPAVLSSTNTTNFLTDTQPRLLRMACLAVANEWKKDWGAADRYLARLGDEVMTINAKSDLDRMAEESEFNGR